MVAGDGGNHTLALRMNSQPRYILLTVLLVLAVLVGGAFLFTTCPDLQNIAFIGLLVLAGIGSLVQGRVKQRTSSTTSCHSNASKES